MDDVDRKAVAALLERVDAAFRADDGSAMAEAFAADARLLWPEIEDIVGREAIRAALTDLTAAYHTISWEPSYQLFDVTADAAYVLGRFMETRRDRETGAVEHIPGRILYICRREDDAWGVTHLLTSRYGEERVEVEP